MATEPGIGTKIKRARERLLMSQEELAVKLRVSRSAVNSWERGRSYPRNRIGALEELLGISLTAEAAPEPEPELVATDDWERSVIEDRYLSGEDKRLLISSSRDARAEAVRVRRARRQQREGQSAQPDAGQSGRRT